MYPGNVELDVVHHEHLEPGKRVGVALELGEIRTLSSDTSRIDCPNTRVQGAYIRRGRPDVIDATYPILEANHLSEGRWSAWRSTSKYGQQSQLISSTEIPLWLIAAS